jgi:ATP-dependent helicase HrpB
VQEDVIRWDDETNRVVGFSEKKIGPLTLERKILPVLPDDKRIEVLCAAVREKGLKFIGWSDDHEVWQARVMSLRKWRPEEDWPDVGEEYLLNTIESWLAPYTTGVTKQTDWQRLDLEKILSSILPWHLLNKLDVLVPLRFSVPSGSLIRIKYFIDGSTPVMEVRLQEVFGLLETPRINEGRTRLLMHLLSPGFRPVQVTQDLHSFWENTYREVRKELRVRYAKHHWPEDPWTAQAVRGVKRKTK